MHPLLIQERAHEHRRDLLRRAERAALVRSARHADHRHRRPRWAIPSSIGRCLGILLIRIGGRLVARRQPETAPCPWCDLAFPLPERSSRVPAASAPPLVGVRD